MERDFMGLRAKVKQEVPEENSAPVRGPTMQWSFSNKGSVPQFLSFDAAKDDKPKTGFEALASTGLVTITTTEAVDSSKRPYSSHMQKNMVLEKQGGAHYTVSTYPPKPFDAHSVHRPHEVRKSPLTSQIRPTVSSVAMSTSVVHQSFISPVGQGLIGSTNPQPLSVTSLVPAKTATSPVVGTTELRHTTKTAGAPAQLTIFYAGSVCVYDNISPEKAQAIMLLAGNGPPLASSTVVPAVPAVPVQASTVRPSIIDSFVVNQSCSTTPRFSSPVAVTSISSSQSAGGSVGPNDINTVRTIGTLKSPSNKGEPSKTVSPQGSVPPAILPSGSAVPQFRKASLARFLEKRKERVLSTGPYANANDNRQPQECNTPGSASRSLSMNSSGPYPLPATS